MPLEPPAIVVEPSVMERAEQDTVRLPSMSAASVRNSRVRVLVRTLMVFAFASAIIVPVVVVSLRAVGVIEPDQYYPHPAAWPTIFASAILLTVGINLAVWLRLTAHETFRRAIAGIALPLLIVGSFIAVTVFIFAGYAIYFRLPD